MLSTNSLGSLRGLKTVFFGMQTTGKSTIIMRLKEGIYYSDTPCTIGVSFVRLHNDGITYDIWDSAGSERFLSLMPMYLRGAALAIFVFDVTNERTLDYLYNYKVNLSVLPEHTKIIIIGNKTDLLTKEDEPETLEFRVKSKIAKLGMTDFVCDYVYVSAKTGDGFDTLLVKMNEHAKNVVVIPDTPVVKISYEEDESKCYC